MLYKLHVAVWILKYLSLITGNMLSSTTGVVLLALLASTAPLGSTIQVSQLLNSAPATLPGPNPAGQGGYNNPGGFFRPGDLPFTDPALIRNVQGVNPEQVRPHLLSTCKKHVLVCACLYP